jgi:hypothetical protein
MEVADRAQQLRLVVWVDVISFRVIQGDPGGLLSRVAGPRLVGVRMGLDTQRLVCGEKLEQERQPGAVLGHHRRAQRGDWVGVDDVREGDSPAVAHEARRRARVGSHPQFRLGRLGGRRPALHRRDRGA